MIRNATLLAALMLVAIAPEAWSLGKGSSMFAIELTNGTADFADSTNSASAVGFTGYMSSYSHTELGVQAQYWYMMSDDYAVTLSGGIGFFSETDKQGSKGTPAGGPDLKATSSSFNIRIGGDRVARISDRAVLYGGPGLEFWSGKAKYKNFSFVGPREYEGEVTTRIGLSARLGGIMKMNDSFGLTSHVGTRMGIASAEEQGAKASWWPSSLEGAMGLVFMFGGQ